MRDSSSTPSRLVFGKVGNEHFLSEAWLCDQAGLLLTGTKKEHEHETVKDLQQNADLLAEFLK